jgi:UPF0176 protein
MSDTNQNIEAQSNFWVLLYYGYAKIDDPVLFREKHHELCLELNLRGRIIVAPEGLNGTVCGNPVDCQKYISAVRSDSRFEKMDFKIEASQTMAFRKLHVRVKPEIVNSGLTHIFPSEKTGIHLQPAEWKQLKDQPDVVILDVRSNYEHQVGKFKNAITLDIENFREFPEKVKQLLPKLKGKKILTYCTGGIKCEKASAYLLEQGVQDVYQLHGGIIKYGLEEGGYDFEGKCYVFDGRVVASVNKVNPTIISKCYICQKPCDRMVNCANPDCNLHTSICEECAEQYKGACSHECMASPNKREYDGTGYYAGESNGYNPRLHSKRLALSQ